MLVEESDSGSDKKDEEHGSSHHIWRSPWRPLGPGGRPTTAVKEEFCRGGQVLQEFLCWRTGGWQFVYFVISIGGAKASYIFFVAIFFSCPLQLFILASCFSWATKRISSRSSCTTMDVFPLVRVTIRSTTWSSLSSLTSPSGLSTTSSFLHLSVLAPTKMIQTNYCVSCDYFRRKDRK